MSRKNSLKQFRSIVDGDMSQGQLVSAVTNIQWADNIGIQLNFTGGTGDFEVQVSADYNQDFMGNVINAGHWVPLSLSPSPAASGSADQIYIDITQTSSPFIRVVFNNTFIGSGSVATIADTGAMESTDITTVADVAGSLNSKYFTFSNGNNVINYYVWYNINSAGVDPAIPGKTGIMVAGATGATANTLATATRSALSAASNVTITGATNHVIITNNKMGATTNAADGGAPTGFGFSLVTNGVNSNLLNKYYLINTDGVDYYVWMNVNSEGVDPAVPSRTGIMVAFAAGAINNTVASADGTALAAVPEITNIVTVGHTTTFDQTNPGPGFSVADSIAAPTNFTIGSTGGSGVLNCYITHKMI